MDVTVHLTWIPSHAGIEANETVDRMVRALSQVMFKGRVEASPTISFSTAVRLSSDIARKSWQRKCGQETMGCFTKQMIPNVGSKVVFQKDHDAGISYCRLLLHDTHMLNDDGHRTGVSNIPICDHGIEHETSQHFLIRCCNQKVARKTMYETICDIWNLYNHTDRPNLSK